MEPQPNPPLTPAPAPAPAPVENQPQPGWFKRHPKFVHWLLIPIIVLLILFGIYLLMPTILHFVAGQDISSPDDQDLQLTMVSIPDNQNAYFDLVKLSSMEIYEPEGFSSLDIVEGRGWNQALVEEVLTKNTLALAYFSEAASKPQYQDPALADPSKINLADPPTPMNIWRTVSRLSVIKAELLSRQGKGPAAMDEAMKSVRIGHLMQTSQGTLINYLVGNAIKNYGLEMIQQNLRYQTFTEAELKNYSRQLNNYQADGEGLKNAFKHEYWVTGNAVAAIQDPEKQKDFFGEDTVGRNFQGKTYNKYYFKPNQTKKYFADITRKRLNKIDGQVCGGPADVPLFFPDGINFFAALKLPLTENVIGKILHDVISVSLEATLTRRCEQNALQDITQLHLAAKAYMQNNGDKLPPSLSALAPTYIDEVPSDPFDGLPMKYSASKAVIYSIGENLVDDGGDSTTDGSWNKMIDLTFKLR